MPTFKTTVKYLSNTIYIIELNNRKTSMIIKLYMPIEEI